MFGNNKFKGLDSEINKKASCYNIEITKTLNKNKVLVISISSFLIIILIIAGISIILESVKKENEHKAYIAGIEKIQKEEQKKQEEENAIKEAQRQAKLPKLTEQGLKNMENVFKSEIKRVFLTFDDGPSANTTRILDLTKQENIKVTFFELGVKVDAMPEIVKRSYDEGHYIANHSYTHIYSKVYQSPEAVLGEYNQCLAAIRNAIGEQEYDPHLFRFPGGARGGPYGDLKVQAKELLKQNKILDIDWNALSGDAEGNNLSVEKLMARLDETVGGKNSVVILMHDTQAKSITVDALPQIISYFRDRGYAFENFYDIIK